MKRLLLLLVATGAVVALLVTARASDKPAPRPPAAISSPHTPAPPPSSTPPPVYRAGTAAGAAPTDYGDVRVRVTVAKGRIVQVVALELPHGNPTDVQLSKPAARTLQREVLSAQTADVDVVTGATYTSTGYLTSVQAALDQLT